MHRIRTYRTFAAVVGLAAFVPLHPAVADDGSIDVVASFSILGDMVAQVGGDRINLTTLVGPGQDAHLYLPGPSDARLMAEADLVIVNGLGFEGWLDRLVESSGSEATVVVATTGIDVLDVEDDEHGHDDEDDHAEDDDHGHGDEGDHAEDDDHGHGVEDDHAEDDDHDHGPVDPHGWQDVANAEVYVQNITAALIAADPEGHDVYEANAERYLEELHDLDHDIRHAMEDLPGDRRTVVTSHDAFGYFERAYGITFLGVEGVSTDSEPSAGEIATLIRQIRDDHITGVFVESITDSRMIDQIADETGAVVGGILYSDALSDADGPASTYIDMMRHNTDMLAGTLAAF